MKTTRRKTASATLSEVWALKQAAQDETAHLVDPADYFRYIRQRAARLELPVARAPRRASASDVKKTLDRNGRRSRRAG